MSDVGGIRDEYKKLALDWSDARSDAPLANRIFKAHHALFKKVRNAEAGREAISSLLQDKNDAVRLLAATHALAFDAEAGAPVLEQLSHSSGPFALDAKYTLLSFRSGTLNLDW